MESRSVSIRFVDTNQIYGVAIRMEDDESDIGSSGSTIDTDSLQSIRYTEPFRSVKKPISTAPSGLAN
jgi:hypothetical protein